MKLFFALVLSCSISRAGPLPKLITSFDYWGTPTQEAVLRGKCKQVHEQLVRCELLFVYAKEQDRLMEGHALRSVWNPFRSLATKEKRTTSEETVKLSDLRAFWKKEQIEKLTESEEQYTREKSELCSKEPRDYYDLRGAYNESYDPFVEETKRIQKQICAAASAEQFVEGQMMRWDLISKTCVLDYSTLLLNFWKTETGWASKTAPPGSNVLDDCFQDLEVDLRCASPDDCKFTLNFAKKKKDGLRGISPFLRKTDQITGMKTCEQLEESHVLEFTPTISPSRPTNCTYLLDRERASHCCAYPK